MMKYTHFYEGARELRTIKAVLSLRSCDLVPRRELRLKKKSAPANRRRAAGDGKIASFLYFERAVK